MSPTSWLSWLLCAWPWSWASARTCYSCTWLVKKQDCPSQAVPLNVSDDYWCALWTDANQTRLLRQTYLPQEDCNREEYWTDFFYRRYGVNSTMDCCKDDFCNTASTANTTIDELSNTDKMHNNVSWCSKFVFLNGTSDLTAAPSLLVAMSDDPWNISSLTRYRQKRQAPLSMSSKAPLGALPAGINATVIEPHQDARSKAESDRSGTLDLTSKTATGEKLDKPNGSMGAGDEEALVLAENQSLLNESQNNRIEESSFITSYSNSKTNNSGENEPTFRVNSVQLVLEDDSIILQSPVSEELDVDVSSQAVVQNNSVADTVNSFVITNDTHMVNGSTSVPTNSSNTTEGQQMIIESKVGSRQQTANHSFDDPAGKELSANLTETTTEGNLETNGPPIANRIFIFYIKFKNLRSKKNSLNIRLLDGNLDSSRMYTILLQQMTFNTNLSITVSTEEDNGFGQHSSNIFFNQELPPLKEDDLVGFWIRREISSLEIGLVDLTKESTDQPSIVRWSDPKNFVDVEYLGFRAGGEGVFLEYACNFSQSLLNEGLNEVPTNNTTDGAIPVGLDTQIVLRSNIMFPDDTTNNTRLEVNQTSEDDLHIGSNSVANNNSFDGSNHSIDVAQSLNDSSPGLSNRSDSSGESTIQQQAGQNGVQRDANVIPSANSAVQNGGLGGAQPSAGKEKGTQLHIENATRGIGASLNSASHGSTNLTAMVTNQ